MQEVGSEFLLDNVKDHEELTLRVEVVRTMLHLVLMQIEKTPKLTLKEFLEFTDRIESYGENIPLAVFSKDEGVRVLTLHGSKGLEFDVVFVTGLEDNLFPHKKLSEERIADNEAEEERRLFYVALTRARKKVYLSYAGIRTIFGNRQVNVPSEFIFDIDEEFLAHEEQFRGGGKTIYLD